MRRMGSENLFWERRTISCYLLHSHLLCGRSVLVKVTAPPAETNTPAGPAGERNLLLGGLFCLPTWFHFEFSPEKKLMTRPLSNKKLQHIHAKDGYDMQVYVVLVFGHAIHQISASWDLNSFQRNVFVLKRLNYFFSGRKISLFAHLLAVICDCIYHYFSSPSRSFCEDDIVTETDVCGLIMGEPISVDVTLLIALCRWIV